MTCSRETWRAGGGIGAFHGLIQQTSLDVGSREPRADQDRPRTSPPDRQPRTRVATGGPGGGAAEGRARAATSGSGGRAERGGAEGRGGAAEGGGGAAEGGGGAAKG